MNQLEQKTITSMEVAEMVTKSHNELLKDIRRYADQLGEVKIPQSDFFTESSYKNERGKEYRCYLVTKKGCEFIGNKLTGIKGTEFTAKYINRFHDMEQVIAKPLTQQDMMRVQLGMIDDHEERLDHLENNMVIDYGQQQVLKGKVNNIVVSALGGKASNAYKEIGKKVFSECNKDFQNYFNVNSRNNTPRVKFDTAVSYLESWEPSINTKLQIRNCNSQINMASFEETA